MRMTHSGRRFRLYGRLYQVAGYVVFQAQGIKSLRRKPKRMPAALTGEWADASDCRQIAFAADGSVVVKLYDETRRGSCEVNGSAQVVMINIDGIEIGYRYNVSGNVLTLIQSLCGSQSTFYKIR